MRAPSFLPFSSFTCHHQPTPLSPFPTASTKISPPPCLLQLFLWRTCTFPPVLTQARRSGKGQRSTPQRPSELKRLVSAIAKDKAAQRTTDTKSKLFQAAPSPTSRTTRFCLYVLLSEYPYRPLPPSAATHFTGQLPTKRKPMKAVCGTWQPPKLKKPRQPPDKRTVSVDKKRGLNYLFRPTTSPQVLPCWFFVGFPFHSFFSPNSSLL